MNLDREICGDVLLVRIECGALDLEVIPSLRKRLALPMSRNRKVVFYLRRVECTDCSGIGTLVSLRRKQQKLGGDLYL